MTAEKIKHHLAGMFGQGTVTAATIDREASTVQVVVDPSVREDIVSKVCSAMRLGGFVTHNMSDYADGTVGVTFKANTIAIASAERAKRNGTVKAFADAHPMGGAR